MKFEELTISPNFCHIIDLYNRELSKSVKIAYDPSDECLNPQTIEKTKVSLATRIFGKSTRNAFTYYVENGHPEWKGTSNFVKLIAKWWSLVNVKSVSKGTGKRDIEMEPLGSTNIESFVEFMDEFATWWSE